ncbi:hypothetical protein [Actinomadura sp. 9N215]|uniref:hypothetical protein n=1 Tax=Actinomadura sp. 9N215 TaxID=3375150 RepID=UPI0037A8DE7F
MYRTHEMRLVRIEESGLEEWACPTCGRRMLLRWPPHYRKQVVEPGDERACHVGSSADTTDPAEPIEPAEPVAAPAGAPDDTQEAAPRNAPGPPDEVIERRWRNTRRWLRETAVDARPSSRPARTRLGPSEPV